MLHISLRPLKFGEPLTLEFFPKSVPGSRFLSTLIRVPLITFTATPLVAITGGLFRLEYEQNPLLSSSRDLPVELRV